MLWSGKSLVVWVKGLLSSLKNLALVLLSLYVIFTVQTKFWPQAYQQNPTLLQQILLDFFYYSYLLIIYLLGTYHWLFGVFLIYLFSVSTELEYIMGSLSWFNKPTAAKKRFALLHRSRSLSCTLLLSQLKQLRHLCDPSVSWFPAFSAGSEQPRQCSGTGVCEVGPLSLLHFLPL